MTAVPIADLQPFHRNPRRGDVAVIAESLEKLGQYRPIVVNLGTYTGRPHEVLAGNHTLQAAQRLGWSEIDAHYVDVDDETANRIVLVDNKSNDRAGYDEPELLALIQELPTLEATGWDEADVQALVLGIAPPEDDEPADDIDTLPETGPEPVTKPGDVWILGEHRLICGDSTDPAVLTALFGDERADVMWTDPPYGVDYVGKTADALTIANDTSAQLPKLLAGIFGAALAVIKPGAPVYVAHADTERITFETTLSRAGYRIRQNLIWVKNTIVLGHSDYHYKHEPILEAETPENEAEPTTGESLLQHDPILYGFTPGGDGRLGRGGPRWYGDNTQSTVFEIPKPPANREHPTMKPVKLILAQLHNSLPVGGIVYDACAGSGSTLIAAEHRHARAYVVELDPHYCDVIAKRWQELTGQTPEREGIGPHSFD